MAETNIEAETKDCCPSSCGCGPPVNRRQALQLIGASAAASSLPAGAHAMAGPFDPSDVTEHLVPADKKLSEEWWASLTRRGEAEVFSGDQLQYVGMPVGGIGCGQLYLGGDGRLWLWDIFKCNYTRETGHGQRISAFTLGGHYAHPVAQGEQYTARNGAEVLQGFLIRTNAGTRSLDRHGFPEVRFRGEYPAGKVTYAEVGFPATVELQAFSPFLPLNAKDSALPATVLSFTVTNATSDPIEVDLGGWMQNATCPYTNDATLGQRRNRVVQADGLVSVLSTVEAPADSASGEVESEHGYGSMTLTLLHDASDSGLTASASTALTTPNNPANLFEQTAPLGQQDDAAKPLDQLLVGGLSAAFQLQPGEARTVDFVITWYFPTYNNQEVGRRKQMQSVTDFASLRRHYAAWFDSAGDVAAYFGKNKVRLLEGTRDWNRTWYDSTLPHWLLDRSFIPIDCLATQTFHWFDNGRPYGWEGVDCCPGTCTHVWHYAQAVGRVFPEIERAFREMVDFKAGVGFNPKNGMINYRGENGRREATDGQAGTILRVYREHQMSADNAFLVRIWPNVKKAIEFLIREDGDKSGLLRGEQPHTLDAAWHGPIAWLSGMYLAALAAGEAMAVEMEDESFASECREIIDRGSKNLVTELFDGEYFIHRVDPEVQALNANKGCHIDQVLGQAWANQVGLGRVIPKQQTVSALNSLWKYNFAPDAGRYSLDHIQIEKAFRWYAMPGEAGLLMCTWPKGGATEAIPGDKMRTAENPPVYTGPGGYFNECMNGFEHQVAAHMIYEGDPDSELVQRGLAVSRAVHERYAADKRNPYNEIECSDHYARSMASYGVFLAACGFEYHGPKRRLGFSPRIQPEDFKAPFITAEGWGTFAQTIVDSQLTASIELRHGTLALKTLLLGRSAGNSATGVAASVKGEPVASALSEENDRYVVHFPDDFRVESGQRLEIDVYA